MIMSDLDLGPDSPARSMNSGLQLGSFLVFGSREATTINGARELTLSGQVTISAPFAIGGAAANSAQALIYLAQQLEELAKNPDLQPVPIQFKSGAGVITPCEHDGWYVIESCQIDRWGFGWKTFTPVTLSIRKVNPAGSRLLAMATIGGPLSTDYSGAATNWVAYPVNSSQLAGGILRTGAEGPVTVTVPVAYSPQPFNLSVTAADWFKGGCRVFDARAPIATNPVPTNGTFSHANWVEVKGPDHRFVGDVVITNGLLLLVFSINVLGPMVYLWNTALATPSWQNVGTIAYEDNGFNGSLIQQVSLLRVGLEEVTLAAIHYTSGGGVNCLQTYRLQRGAYAVRINVRPLLTAQNNGFQIVWNAPTNVKAAYNPSVLTDPTLQTNVGMAADSNFGYAAGFINSNTYPFIAGFVYQNKPGGQPYTTGNAFQVALGDTTGPAANAVRLYGFFAVPYGVSGSWSTAGLQGEGEVGSFGAPWISAVDAGSSNGSAAKLPSGSLTNQTNTVIPGSPIVQHGNVTLRAWVRMRVASAASGTVQFRIAIFDATAGTILQSTDYAASGLTTGYLWYPVGPAIQVPLNHSIYVYVSSIATTTTDWFVDEAVITPQAVANAAAGGGPNNSYPQDLWQQFIYERMAKLVRG